MIKPEDVIKRRKDIIPKEIFDAVDKLIVEKFDGHKSVIKQDDLINEVISQFESNNKSITRRQIFDNYYLDIEPYYREAGWEVTYDRPAYNESYPATFKFSIKK